MGFFDEAVRVLETIVEAMQGRHPNCYPPLITGCLDMAAKRPEFTKHMVRVKKHIRPPVRAGPEIWSKLPERAGLSVYGQLKQIQTTEYGTRKQRTFCIYGRF